MLQKKNVHVLTPPHFPQPILNVDGFIWSTSKTIAFLADAADKGWRGNRPKPLKSASLFLKQGYLLKTWTFTNEMEAYTSTLCLLTD